MDSSKYTIEEIQNILVLAETLVMELDKAKFYDMKTCLGEKKNKNIFKAYTALKELLEK